MLIRNVCTIIIITLLLVSCAHLGSKGKSIVGYTATDVLAYSNMNENQVLEKEQNDNLGTFVIVDTGVSNHKDLQNNLLAFKDFVNGQSESYDDNGHGTEVSGLIVGSGHQSNGSYSGILPGMKYIMLKVFDKNGLSNLITLSEGVDWIIANKEKFNIKLVCMSFGFEQSSDFDNVIFKNLMDKLWNNNILLISSAGNDGISGEITLPGIFKNVITVGSLKYEPDKDKDITHAKISDFSSQISPSNVNKPDIYAPGENLITTSIDGGYTVVNGTSFSTAIVTGQIALLMKYYSTENNQEILDIINKFKKNKILFTSFP
jgi:serine protease AprX